MVIVDAFEMIHINHQQANCASEPSSLFEPFVQLVIEESTVVNASKAIHRHFFHQCVSLLLQLFFTSTVVDLELHGGLFSLLDHPLQVDLLHVKEPGNFFRIGGDFLDQDSELIFVDVEQSVRQPSGSLKFLADVWSQHGGRNFGGQERNSTDKRMVGGLAIMVVGNGFNDGFRKPPPASQSGPHSGVVKAKGFAFVPTQDAVIISCQLFRVAEAFRIGRLQWEHPNVLQQTSRKSFVRQFMVFGDSIGDPHGNSSRCRGRGGRAAPKANKIKMVLPSAGHVDQREAQNQ